MLEVGYARCRHIPIVFLLDGAQKEQATPALVGRPNTMYYDGKETHSLDIYAPETADYLLNACFQAQVKRQHTGDVRSSVYSITCYQNRDYLDIPQKIRDARTSVEILTTNLDYFAHQGDDNHPFDLQDLKDAVNRGVKVKIWTMDPDSNFVVERSKLLEPRSERPDVFQYRKALIKNIKTVYVNFIEEIKANKFYLGIYDTLPTLMIYRIDYSYYIPSVSLFKRSRLCIHAEFQDSDPGVKDTFHNALEGISRLARPVQHYSWINEDWPEPYDAPRLAKAAAASKKS
jgi:hypothetical protein